MSDALTIVYYTGGLRIGGMETHLLHLLERIDRRRFAPHVVCLFPSEAYAARIAALEVSLTSLDIPYLNSPARVARLSRLARVLHARRPRILQTYGYTCDVTGPVIARTVGGVRSVTTRRGEDRVRRHQRTYSIVNRVTDCIVCVSRETEAFTRRTERVGNTRIEVIPNGVLAPGVVRTESPRVRFGTLGTVKEIKGTDLLVDAFLGMPPDVDAELVIGGRTDVAPAFSAELERRVAESSRRDRVRFIGYQEDPGAFFGTIDVFVLPSRSEGMSNALLEAMAAGLPCVATDVGSNRSVLHDDGGPRRGGEITAPSAEALSAAMHTMLDASCRARAGTDARSIIDERFSMAHMVHSYESLYASLAER